MFRSLSLLTLLAFTAPAFSQDEDLFNGKDLAGWKAFMKSGQDEDGSTFYAKDGHLVISGTNVGYIYTAKSFKNYVFTHDWKFIKDGNSGILVHITGEPKVWPKCIEVQGLQKNHGHLYEVGGGKGKFTKDADAQKKAIKMGEWNTTEVTVNGNAISVKINGIPVSSGTIENVSEGPIGFQSEGTELHLKNLKLKKL